MAALLPAEGIVVLYCNVDWMVSLIGDWDVEPLLAVSPLKTSLLTSYVALKRLLITGQLKPTIVNMQQDPSRFSSASQSLDGVGLAGCARKFLGHELRTLDVAQEHGEASPCEAVQRLALRLLESAMVLGAEHAPSGSMRRAMSRGNFAPFAGSH